MATEPAGINLEDIKRLVVERQFDDALRRLGVLLGSQPDHPDALYMSAVCCRYRRDFEAALGYVERLKAVMPDHGRAHQEEGHTFRDMGLPDDALRAYARAVRFNPALEASWRSQLDILSRQGLATQAAQVRAQLDALKELPAPLVGVIDLVSQGQLLKAENLCRKFLQKAPQHVEGMRLLADIGMRLGVLDDAEFLLESALKFQPDNLRAQIDYIQVLRKRQKYARALDQARELLNRAPSNPQFQSLYAIECMQSGDYDAALTMFDRILEKLPGDAVTLTSKGHALKTSGDYDGAVNAYHAAVRNQPAHGEAYYSLANLKVYSFSGDEMRRMRDLGQDPDLSHMDRVYVNFALGKAYEDAGDFAASFRHYAFGNRLKKAQSKYDPDRMSEDLGSLRSVCTADFFARRCRGGHDAPDPIFIVGLPRAGSTLLEQILSSHSLVDGTLELPNVPSLAQSLRRRSRDTSGSEYPNILDEISGEEYSKFGLQYITDTRIHRSGAPRFIDKMPNNFRHVGLILAMLPNATIIDARRSPMACCFSGYKQLFAEGQEFSYDLNDIGRYYRDYVELMDHWDRVLPGKVLRVQYEEVVADIEGQVRRILDHCGLPFEPACIEFHKTRRSVRTPSSEQVRQPIYTSGLDYWRNFEAWLGPLKEALGADLRSRYGISV